MLLSQSTAPAFGRELQISISWPGLMDDPSHAGNPAWPLIHSTEDNYLQHANVGAEHVCRFVHQAILSGHAAPQPRGSHKFLAAGK